MKKFLGLLTRCKDEYFIKEFVDYYLSQGVDLIYIIDDDSNDKSIYDSIKNYSKVIIIFDNNIIKKNSANKIFQKIKQLFQWLIYVDVDEFITTKKNINFTIKQELQTTFKHADCIKIPWVMMSCNNITHNPKSLLKTNIYRWNHNLKHPHKIKKFRCRYRNMECKTIFKPYKFKNIHDHNPSGFIYNQINCINSINLKPIKIQNYYNNLREYGVNNGYLLCYHYRIISIENSINKLKNNKWYIDNKYNIDDLMSSDHPEIIDETLKNKSIH